METNEEYLKKLLPKLKKPIPYKWRVQSFSKNKPQATVVAYIDARDCMDILDANCTYGWHRKHYVLGDKMYCETGVVMPDGTIQWRSDCGVESNTEASKGESSDSYKRSCVNWGIGRFLYDLEIQYVTANEVKTQSNYPYPIDEAGKRIWDLTSYINNKNPNTPKAPVQVPEPSTDEKVANMQKPKVDISEHKELIAKITTATGLNGYYTSLSNEDKANQAVVDLLTDRREKLNIPKSTK